jgi:hypothetical protein
LEPHPLLPAECFGVLPTLEKVPFALSAAADIGRKIHAPGRRNELGFGGSEFEAA